MGLKFDTTVRTEADLLCEFHHQCRLVGIDLRMEACVYSSLHRSKRMRVDAAVIKGDRIIAFVEGKTPGAKVGGNTRQKHAYASYLTYHGISTFWINDFDQIDKVITLIQQLPAMREAA